MGIGERQLVRVAGLQGLWTADLGRPSRGRLEQRKVRPLVQTAGVPAGPGFLRRGCLRCSVLRPVRRCLVGSADDRAPQPGGVHPPVVVTRSQQRVCSALLVHVHRGQRMQRR